MYRDQAACYLVEKPSIYRDLVDDLLSLRHEFAMCHHFIEVDLSHVAHDRKVRLEQGRRQPSYTSYIMQALSRVLPRHPRLNSHLVTFPKRYLAIYAGVDVIYTIEVPGPAGPVVMLDVLRNADRLELDDVDAHLAAKAATSLDQLFGAGPAARFAALPKLLRRLYYRLCLKPFPGRHRDLFGTCAFTTVGKFGSEFAIPIIPRTIGIHAGALKQRPIARGGAVVIAPTVWLTVTHDHRVVDGGDAARFSADVKRSLEGLDAESEVER